MHPGLHYYAIEVHLWSQGACGFAHSQSYTSEHNQQYVVNTG
uniref:Uncharacterized protein n=1 Tax=Arundo donax TaxID=35708 RepID=A0A0A9DXF2_ARUDO